MIGAVAKNTARLVVLLFGVLLILLAVITIFVRLGLPFLGGYKDGIESRVSEYLQGPVDIGELSMHWEGFGPLLRANDVAVLETPNRAVRLDELLIDVNLVKSLMRGTPVINEITLIGADLALETDISGQLQLHGKQLISGVARSSNTNASSDDVINAGTGNSGENNSGSGSSGSGVNLAAWLFNARKVGLQDARLTLIDQQSSGQLVIDELNIRAENEGNLHQLRVDALLPAELGGRVEAGIDLIGDAPALHKSHGSVYVAADALNWNGLSQILLLSGLFDNNDLLTAEIDARASLELWGTWQDGKLVSARGPLDISNVVDLETGETLLDNVNTQLRLVHGDDESTVLASELKVAYGEQSLTIDEVLARRVFVPESSSVDSAQTQDNASADQLTQKKAGRSQWRVSSQSKELPADLTMRLATAGLAFVQPALSRQLSQFEFVGTMNNVALNMGGSNEEPRLNLGADINALALRGHPSLPLIGPLNGDISLVDSTGYLNLSGNGVALQWKNLSDQNLVVDEITSALSLDFRNPSKLLVGADVFMLDEGIETNTRLKATLASGSSAHLDVQSRFSASDVTAVKAWIPRKILAPAAVKWIDNAITAGSAENGTLLFFGHVADFPFDNGQGVLNASVDIRDGEVAYLENWPVATHIEGTMELEGLSLVGDVNSGKVGDFDFSQAVLTIDNLLTPVFRLNTTASGTFDRLLAFAVDGPMQDFLEPAIGDLVANGSAQMDLSLQYPLYLKPAASNSVFARNWRPFTVNGSLFFNGNDVEFGRAGLTLNNAKGAVGFDRYGITINSLRGNLLGHPVRITGKTEGRGLSASTNITVRGSVEANDLLAHYENLLDRYIRGTSQWQVTMSAPHSASRVASEGVSLTIESDLVGSELLLPHPFNKSSVTAASFSLGTAFKSDTREQLWEAHYDGKLRAQVRTVDNILETLLIDVSKNRQVLSDTPIDAAALRSLEGIRLQGNIESLAAEGWVDTIAGYIDSFPETDGQQTPILPVSAELDADRLTINGVSLGSAQVSVNTDATFLNAVVSNQAVSGELRYPREHWTKDTAMTARLSKLDWSVIDALNEPNDTALSSDTDALDPRLLPPIEATVVRLIRDEVELKDLVIRTRPNVSGIDITSFGFAYDTMRMVGQGSWYLRDPQNLSPRLTGKHTTQLDLVLQSNDFGRGLDSVGLDGMVDEGIGSVSMNLSWPGPLYKPEIARLDGDIDVDIRDGSIVPLEPEAGRVVGLFAIQALPRRLKFDFKDVTNAGLAFSRIAGSARIDNGLADIPLLQLSGPIGVVDIMGSSNLNTQQIEQTVTVLPRVSAALPVIGAIAGGASAGIGALVATGILKAMGLDFDRIGLVSYRLSGSWQEPAFDRISNNSIRSQ